MAEGQQTPEAANNNNYDGAADVKKAPQDAKKGPDKKEKPDELDQVLGGVDALTKIIADHPEAANGAYANFMLGIYRTEAWQKVERGWDSQPDWVKGLLCSRWAKYLPLGPLSSAPEGFRFLVEAGLLSAPQNTNAEEIGEASLADTKIMGVIAAAVVVIFAPEALPKIIKLLPQLIAIGKLRKGLNENSRTAIAKERIARKEINELREETGEKIANTTTAANDNENYKKEAA